jgi:hypothetical protein
MQKVLQMLRKLKLIKLEIELVMQMLMQEELKPLLIMLKQAPMPLKRLPIIKLINLPMMDISIHSLGMNRLL